MKVIERNSDVVEQIGDLESENFKIKASAKSFEILSKGIYTDLIRPPIRELATNAWDSHVAAGNLHTPFEVHVPSLTEPYFYVQDYGVGMSHADVKNIYTTYFESTKIESNDYVGCLGLGSKSPFCYSDTFNVESIHGGIKSLYICYTENGMPKVSFIESVETDEHSGMKISFAVKTEDINTFRKEIADIYSYFKHRPKLLNAGDLKLNNREFELVRKDYKFSHKNGNRYEPGNVNIVMGNIVYVVRKPHMTPNDRDIDWLFDCGVEFEMPIGAVEIAANRESIHFDERSKRNIRNKLNFIATDIRKELQEKINNFPSYWEAALYVNTFNSFQYNWEFKSRVLNFMTYNGRKIESVFKLENFDPKFVPDDSYNRRNPNYKSPKIRYFTNGGIGRSSSSYDSRIKLHPYTQFVFNDLKKGKGGISRCRYYVKQNPNKYLYIIKDDGDDKIKDLSSEILEYFGLTTKDVLYTSKMKSPPTTPRKKGERKEDVQRDVHYFCRPWRSYWRARETDYFTSRTIEDITKGKHLYVITHGGSVVPKSVKTFVESKEITSSQTIQNSQFRDKYLPVMRKLFKELKIEGFETTKDGEVVVNGVNYFRSKPFLGKKNWINLFELLEKCVELYVKKYKKDYIRYKKWESSLNSINHPEVVGLLKLFPNDSVLKQLDKDIVEYGISNCSDFIVEFENILKFGKIEISKTEYKVEDRYKEILSIYEKYPLLKPNPTHQDLTDYIKIIDNK